MADDFSSAIILHSYYITADDKLGPLLRSISVLPPFVLRSSSVRPPCLTLKRVDTKVNKNEV